jgi:hypothetical protein
MCATSSRQRYLRAELGLRIPGTIRAVPEFDLRLNRSFYQKNQLPPLHQAAEETLPERNWSRSRCRQTSDLVSALIAIDLRSTEAALRLFPPGRRFR